MNKRFNKERLIVKYHVTMGNFLNLYIGSYGEINKNSY
jgi:hypothetical protein